MIIYKTGIMNLILQYFSNVDFLYKILNHKRFIVYKESYISVILRICDNRPCV